MCCPREAKLTGYRKKICEAKKCTSRLTVDRVLVSYFNKRGSFQRTRYTTELCRRPGSDVDHLLLAGWALQVLPHNGITVRLHETPQLNADSCRKRTEQNSLPCDSTKLGACERCVAGGTQDHPCIFHEDVNTRTVGRTAEVEAPH
ncbi:uncharacterized protein LOC121861706 isoform X3 [Homarus americanus]|uniref:uncharacterized protein LOC121861706 isoform X3 n=1 Tax=Homarus americanus TaxID=6706 RepID=UPI001C486EA1|nr:uncharacterized protein LOC121861706 isoform X3 [Homarus americanus]